MRKIYCVPASLFLIAICFCGCVDSWRHKTIVSDYYLEKTTNNDYYLQREYHEVDGVGLVEGTIEQIGWSDSEILVLRHACFRGDPDGWMAIDTIHHKIAGPISDSERRVKYGTIICYPVEFAWGKL